MNFKILILVLSHLLFNFQPVHSIDSEEIELKNPHIVRLDLSERFDLDREKRLYSTFFLTRFNTLSNLDLSNCSEIYSLKHVADCKTLKKLNLSGCYNIIFDLNVLSNLTNIEELNINYIYIEEAFRHVARHNAPSLDFIIPLTKLKKLYLAGNVLLKRIEPVTRVPSLKLLDITACDGLEDKHILLPQSIEKIIPSIDG